MKNQLTSTALTTLLLSLSLPIQASALTVRTSKDSTRICKDYTIPVSISTVAFVPIYTPFSTPYSPIGFLNALNRRDKDTSFVPFLTTTTTTTTANTTTPVLKPFSATYQISGTLCTPTKDDGKTKTLMLATHGLGYDKRYWDSGYEKENYNFVDWAVGKGYSVFYYDRLGTGASSKVPGYNEPQAWVQLAILQQLTILIKTGKYNNGNGVPSKIVHVGHSFGSFLSNALIGANPSLSDGVILTGSGYYSDSGKYLETWSPRSAPDVSSGKWAGRDKHYVTWVDAFAHEASFFYPGSFDVKALAYAESIKQPVAAVEILTLATLNLTAAEFKGPVMTISGEFDLLVCGGYCPGIVADWNKETFFPKASDFKAAIHPGVGHGINLSYNATGAYKAVTEFLAKNGL